MSVPTTSRSGRSSFSASATAPLPVPTSTTRAPEPNRSASNRGVSHPASESKPVARFTASLAVSEKVASGNRSLGQTSPLLVVLERIRELVELANQDPVEVVREQVDPVVLDPLLGEVVRADLLGALAGAHLGLARRRKLG